MNKLPRWVRSASFVIATSAVSLAIPRAADATTFVCTSQKAYDYEAGSGALEPSTSHKVVWPRKWTFNDTNGLLDYGQSEVDKLTVTSRGSTVSAHYARNGTIHSAIDIRVYEQGARFVWLKGGNVLLLSGTCELIGNVPDGTLWSD
jgi:hypothetical protein